jgi:hypothetical protein
MNDLCDAIGGLAEALRSFPLKEALDLEAVGRYARTIGLRSGTMLKG